MIIQVTGSRHATYGEHGSYMQRILFWAATGMRDPNGPSPLGVIPNPTYELWDGLATGADSIAHNIAVEFGWDTRRYTADWSTCDPNWVDPLRNVAPCQTPRHRGRRKGGGEYCPLAGHRRNQMMIDALVLEKGPKVCVAFPILARGSTGTTDCLTRAWRAGIPTLIFPLD